MSFDAPNEYIIMLMMMMLYHCCMTEIRHFNVNRMLGTTRVIYRVSINPIHPCLKCRYLFASSYVERVMTNTGPTYRTTNNLVSWSILCELQEKTPRRF